MRELALCSMALEGIQTTSPNFCGRYSLMSLRTIYSRCSSILSAMRTSSSTRMGPSISPRITNYWKKSGIHVRYQHPAEPISNPEYLRTLSHDRQGYFSELLASLRIRKFHLPILSVRKNSFVTFHLSMEEDMTRTHLYRFYLFFILCWRRMDSKICTWNKKMINAIRFRYLGRHPWSAQPPRWRFFAIWKNDNARLERALDDINAHSMRYKVHCR